MAARTKRLFVTVASVLLLQASVLIADAGAEPVAGLPAGIPEGAVLWETRSQPQVGETQLSSRTAVDPYCVNDRANSCASYRELVEHWMRETPTSTPVLVGAWNIDFTLKARSLANEQRSTVTFNGKVTIKSGMPIPGELTISIDVQEPMVGAGRAIKTITMPLAVGATASDQVAYFAPLSTYFSLHTDLQYTWNSVTPVPAIDPLPTSVSTRQSIRCDRAQEVNYGTGCVNPHYIPIVSFPSSSYPYISPNIQAGQAATVLGVPGIETITRTNTAQTDRNRALACSTARTNALPPPPDGMTVPSCDEYPFASTLQGGERATIAWVPKAENDQQGQTIIDFYRKSRVMEGDGFYVQP